MARDNSKAKKRCLMCNQVKSVMDFSSNRGWIAQQNCDLYCKQCAKGIVHDKDTLRKYMWENNRLYSEPIWEAAYNRAKRRLINNVEYNRKSTTAKRKKELEDELTAQDALIVMNLPQYYRYNENADENGNLDPFDADSLRGMIVETEDGKEVMANDPPRYSKVWNGMFTQRELEYLDDYYEKLNDSFNLDDISAQDYARKVAKASLEADTRYDAMRAGKLDSKSWREAQDVFDSLSKSSAFTAAQRKDRGQDTMKSLAEIIAEIEINHHAVMPQVTFPPDDIDRILSDFRHTTEAIK